MSSDTALSHSSTEKTLSYHSDKTAVYPFRALRFTKEGIDQKVAPPYDVISKTLQDKLASNPENVIHLILNPVQANDSENENAYTRAAQNFQQWQHSGTLSPEAKPAMYAYQQSWADQDTNEPVTRQGWLMLLKLESYETKRVLPHEFTLKGPKSDRLNLMKSTMANFSPIFMIYEDPDGRLEQTSLPSQDWVSITDSDQVTHRFSAVSEPDIVQSIQALMADQRLLIADGHHRYETALAFRDAVRERLEKETGRSYPLGSLPTDYLMVFVTNLHDPGLKVYPTDRVLYQWPSDMTQEKLEAALPTWFETCSETEALITYEPAVGKTQYLRLKSNCPAIDLPEPLKALDTAILDATIFQQVFGKTQEALKIDHLLGFYRDKPTAKALLKDNKAVAVFWMGTPPVKLMKSLCESGYRMPQKSTYFYPKLLSGLAFYSYKPLPDGSHPVPQSVQTLPEWHWSDINFKQAIQPDH